MASNYRVSLRPAHLRNEEEKEQQEEGEQEQGQEEEEEQEKGSREGKRRSRGRRKIQDWHCRKRHSKCTGELVN